MPPKKNNNRKSSRSGNPATRAAQQRPRPDSDPPGAPSEASLPAGLVSAKNARDRQAAEYAKLIPPAPTSAAPSSAAPSSAAPPSAPSALKRPAKSAPAKSTAAKSTAAKSTATRSVAAPVAAPVPVPAAEPAPAEPETEPASAADDVPKWAAKAVEELLTPTYWLDPGEAGEPFSATIRFSGRRTDVTGKPQPRDSFWHEETVDAIIPGSGPVAITAEVRGINPGDWTVTARSVARVGGRPYRSYPPPGHDPNGTYRVPPPRRVGIPVDSTATMHTSSLLRSKVPGVIRFAYATLVGLGVLVGLGLEALLLSHGHYALFRPMLFSVIAIVAGVIGGKGWYIAVHRGKKFDGWCIQGFVAGAAVVVAAAALAGPGIPAGAYLAAAAPALLIGMSIGRPGCFWAGCCTGRPTAARWGVWSSDRRLGCRRAPAQLLEALSALISGGVVLIVVLVDGLARSGPVAVVGLAAYTLARQFILGLRAEPRVWPYGRRVTGAVAALALIAGIVLLVK
jgi:phosphatidylglycerol---prolipoprotein diacylglyceryl transferase